MSRALSALVLTLVLLVAGFPAPLWSLEEVAELSELLHRAEGRDRGGFLDVLAEADPDAAGDEPTPSPSEDEDEDDDDDQTTPAESSSSDSSGSTAKGGHIQRPTRRQPVLRRPLVPVPRAVVPGLSPPLPGLLEEDAETDNDDDIKWFNAQAFMKWLVRSLAALYEGLVKLMLLPLHMVISIIDV